MTQGALSKPSQAAQAKTDSTQGDDASTLPSRTSGKREIRERPKTLLKQSTHKRSHSQKTGTHVSRRNKVVAIRGLKRSLSVKHVKSIGKRVIANRHTTSVTKPSCHHGKPHHRRSGSRKGRRSCSKCGGRKRRSSHGKKRSCKRHHARKSSKCRSKSRKNRCLKKRSAKHHRACHKTRCDKGKHHCMSGKHRKTRCDKGRHHKKCGGRGGKKRAVSGKVEMKKSSLPSPGKNRVKALFKGRL